jgi:hypothetical protein
VGKVNFPASGVGTPDPEKRCTGLEPLTIESVSLLSLRVLSEDMRYSNVSNIYLSYNLWTCKLFLSDSSQIVVVVRCCKNLCSFQGPPIQKLDEFNCYIHLANFCSLYVQTTNVKEVFLASVLR